LPRESVRAPVFAEPVGQIPAAVSGLASVPVPTPTQGVWEQQKLPWASFRVPVFVCPAGQAPAAVFGLASTPLPKPWHAGGRHVTVTVAVVSEDGQTAPAWSVVTTWMVSVSPVAGHVKRILLLLSFAAVTWLAGETVPAPSVTANAYVRLAGFGATADAQIVEVLPGAAVFAVALIAVSVETVGQSWRVAFTSTEPLTLGVVHVTRTFTMVSFPAVTANGEALAPEQVTVPPVEDPLSVIV
jgi:hypothetical protein